MKKQKKEKKKGSCLSKFLIVIVVLFVICAVFGGSDDDEGTESESTVMQEIETESETEFESITESEMETKTENETETESEIKESHIYDNAEIVDMMNGSMTEKIGEVSTIYADSSEITMDVLEDWYFNYVAIGDYNYYIIAYTDIENTGCYGSVGIVEAGLKLESDEDGTYYMGDDSAATMYLPSDGSLVESGSVEFTETETEMPESTIYYATHSVNVRSAANTSSDVLAVLTAGDEVSVLSIDGDWAVIEYNGGTAYISANYLTDNQNEISAETEAQEKTVYITNTGTKYHRSGCRYLDESKIAIGISKAISRGYTACSVCNP